MNKTVVVNRRDQREVAPADSWKWGRRGHKEYKWKGSFLGYFLGLVVSVQETFILPEPLWLAQYKIIFPHCTLFKVMCPHRPATWSGSRAGPLVSLNVCLPWLIFQKWHTRGQYTWDMCYLLQKGNPEIHPLNEIFCNFSRRIGVLAFCMPGNGGFAKFSFPNMINLLQGNKYRQRYRVYLLESRKALVRELFETKSNNLSILKQIKRRGLWKSSNIL